MPKTPEKPSFTKSAEALDEILDRFRSGHLPLEDALALFEQGIGHLKICQTQLAESRGKVEELIQTLNADGEAITRPFED